MEDKLQTLVEQILAEYDLPNIDKVNVNIKADNNKFTITISGDFANEKEEEFKNWCQSIDDDLFVEACEKFESITGIPLKEVTDYDLFKNVVRQIAQEKIQKLQNYIK